jgi:prespore-specific regulator
MRTTRSDAWNENEDYLLAQTVIQHIREGSTQLNAFEEVGEKLNRTAAACGFRWNSNVRKKYRADILLAKQIRQEARNTRKSHDRSISTQALVQYGVESQLSINAVISFLKDMRNTYHQMKTQIKQLKKKLEQTSSTLNDLHQERERLLNILRQHEESHPSIVDDDYQALLSIVEHANRLLEHHRAAEISHEKTG